jgi:Trk K+ transport system NAD-binding subunit
MKTMIANPSLSVVACLGSGELESVMLEIPKGLVGRKIKDFVIPGESVVGALVRRGQAEIPSADTKLELGDKLHITAMVSAIPRLEKLISH